MTIAYLLAWKPELDIQDNQGYTPLHLSINSSQSVNSTRAVRYLLTAGARKDIRDTKGNTAMDLIDNLSDPDLQNELRRMLVRNFCSLCRTGKTY